jgi:hypothetical protein
MSRFNTKKQQKANKAVSIQRLAGYIENSHLRRTVFDAAIRQGGFKRAEIWEHWNSGGYKDCHEDRLMIFINTKIERRQGADDLTFAAVPSNTSLKNYYSFGQIPAYVTDCSVYTGTCDTLHNSVTLKNTRGEDIIVADIIYPNIISIRIMGMKFGCASGRIHENNDVLWTFQTLSYIIREGCNLLKLPKREFLSRIIRERKENLAKIIHSRIETMANAVKERIISCEDQISQKRKEISDLEVSLKSEKEALEAYSSIMSNLREKFMRELEIVRNIKQVTSVDEYSCIDKGIISVDVEGIKAKCQRNWYYFGDYTINIDISQSTVRFLNKSGITRKSYWGEGCQHPHCSYDGRPCLGNLSTQVAELLKSLDIAFLVNLCISYLQSVNIHDIAGKNVVNWPVCDEEGNILHQRNEDGLIQCTTCGKYMREEGEDGWEQCDDCLEWMCPDHIRVRDTEAGEIHICNECSMNYACCSHCGKYEFRDTMIMCDVCGSLVCPSCLSDEFPRFAYYSGNRVMNVCKEHEVHRCEGCGLYLVETDTCPSCHTGSISVGVCAICGDTTPTDLFREDYTDVCAYCDPTGYSRCSRCGRYDLTENLTFDVVTGECYHEDCEIPEDFDPATIADAGAIELQQRYIENAILEYTEANNITVSDDWVEDAVERMRAQIINAMGVPQDFLIGENGTTEWIERAIIEMIRQHTEVNDAVAEAVEEERIVADAELTPLPEGIQEFYNQPVMNEEALLQPEGAIYEEPIVDDTITG